MPSGKEKTFTRANSGLENSNIHEQTIAVAAETQTRKLMTFVPRSANVEENCQNVFR